MWRLAALACLLGLVAGERLEMSAPVSPAVENEVCRNHSLLYLRGVLENRLWALQMLDASSKIQSGILMGNLVDLGNFDECLGVKDVVTASGQFSGQYCMVTAGNVLLSLGMRWAVCIPSTCTPRDLEQHLQSLLPNITVTVGDLACSSEDKTRAFTGADWFAVGFILFFTALVILSTAYDLAYRKSESRRALLLSFSVYSNGKKLLKVGDTQGTDSLPAVHGIRFLSMAWVVLGHTYLFGVVSPVINLTTIVGYLTDWAHVFVTNATLSVDSFFLLSGLLVCYVFLKEMDKGASFNLPLYYIHRYIRLTPALGAMILLTATLFYYIGDGPLWKSGNIMVMSPCQDNWWVTLLYINNYYRQDRMCLGQSWYLAVDMQLFWVSPLILYPLWRWPKFGKAIWGVLVFAGLLTAFLIPYINEFPADLAGAGGKAGELQYFPTHARFTPWLIGIGLGYLIHVTKKTPVRLSPLVATVGWLLSAGLMLTSLLLAHRFQQPTHTYNRVAESLYTCLMRPAWALGLAWVLFACTKGYGGFVNTFLSWRFFQVLSRLTYTVYLTHMTIMMSWAGAIRTPLYFSDVNVALLFFSFLVASFAAAFVLSLVFESPAIVIEKALLGKPRKQKPESDVSTIIKNEKMPVSDETHNLEGIENKAATKDDEVSTAGLNDLEAGVPT